jgi:hypothetical protein
MTCAHRAAELHLYIPVVLHSTPSTSASALRLTDIARTPAGAGFQFAAEAGRQYRLEGTEDLASGQWTILLDHIPGTGGVLQVTDPNVAGLKQYFYRIIFLP